METLNAYTLEATLGENQDDTVLYAENDTEAVMGGIAEVLNRATHGHPSKMGLWARGHIVLRDGDRVLQEMEAK